jgi:lipopolysaccharide/colanic/teichoic acid biosynthesis glycosyltransferase
MALIALMIKLESPGSVLFQQERVGRNGRRFTVYKFRSMIEGAEEQQEALQNLNEAEGPLFKIRDDPRTTRVGKLLRKLSLDELPQFYNVLRGEMSLIGPRPPLPAEVKQYQEWHKRRLEVSPGITGLSQISGRSELSFDETALLDIYYVENWSLGLDTKIMLQTIPRVIFGNGAY